MVRVWRKVEVAPFVKLWLSWKVEVEEVMGAPFLLQVTVLTGPPLETQDTVCEEGSKVGSSILREPVIKS